MVQSPKITYSRQAEHPRKSHGEKKKTMLVFIHSFIHPFIVLLGPLTFSDTRARWYEQFKFYAFLPVTYGYAHSALVNHRE